VAAAAPFLLVTTCWTPWAAGAIALTWLGRWIHLGRLTVPTPADVPVLLMLGMAGVGLWASLDRTTSVPALWRLVLGVAVFYALVNGMRSAERWRRLALASIAGSLALVFVGLLGTDWQAVRLLPVRSLYERLPQLLHDIDDQAAFHPRIMGMALAAWLPVPAALWLLGPERRLRRWAALCTFLLAAALLLTQSLQGLAGAALGLFFVAVVWRRGWLWLLPLGLGLLLLAVGLYGPARLADTLLSPGNPLGIAVTLRWDMWSRALAMLRDMPYTGIGLDQFALVQSQFYPGVMLGPEPHAHNVFLQAALDLGLPGLLAFLWLLASLGWAAWRAWPHRQDENWRALLIGAVGGTLSYLGAGLLDTVWTSKPSLVLWGLVGTIAALSLAVVPSDATEARAPRSAWVWRWLPLALIAILLLPGLCMSPTAPARNTALVVTHRLLWSTDRGVAMDRDRKSRLATQLESLAAGEADNPQLAHLLGRVRAELGEYEAALAAFEGRVALDGEDALARYAPWELWRRRLTGEAPGDPWRDLLWIYSQWQSRFPQRAEYYVLPALVRAGPQHDLPAAVRVIHAGLDRGAEPQGLLQHYSAALLSRLPATTTAVRRSPLALRAYDWPSPVACMPCDRKTLPRQGALAR
jgi:putative inorganic carbon (HCO3(-)) transporter